MTTKHSSPPLTPPLIAVISSFARRPDARACADEWVAYGGCATMAARFTAACRAAGLAAASLQLAVVDDDGALAGRHYVTKVGGVTVDWTARQFARSASELIPLPLLTSTAEMLAPLPDLLFDVADVMAEPEQDARLTSDQPDWPEPPGARRRQAFIKRARNR